MGVGLGVGFRFPVIVGVGFGSVGPRSGCTSGVSGGILGGGGGGGITGIVGDVLVIVDVTKVVEVLELMRGLVWVLSVGYELNTEAVPVLTVAVACWLEWGAEDVNGADVGVTGPGLSDVGRPKAVVEDE